MGVRQRRSQNANTVHEQRQTARDHISGRQRQAKREERTELQAFVRYFEIRVERDTAGRHDRRAGHVHRQRLARVPQRDVPVLGIPMRRHAQVGTSGHRRTVPAGQLHRGRGGFPDEQSVPPAVQHVLRQVDREQPVHVVRRPVAVLRQPPEVQQATVVYQVQGTVRQNGREQEIHHQRTGNRIAAEFRDIVLR